MLRSARAREGKKDRGSELRRNVRQTVAIRLPSSHGWQHIFVDQTDRQTGNDNSPHRDVRSGSSRLSGIEEGGSRRRRKRIFDALLTSMRRNKESFAVLHFSIILLIKSIALSLNRCSFVVSRWKRAAAKKNRGGRPFPSLVLRFLSSPSYYVLPPARDLYDANIIESNGWPKW